MRRIAEARAGTGLWRACHGSAPIRTLCAAQPSGRRCKFKYFNPPPDTSSTRTVPFLDGARFSTSVAPGLPFRHPAGGWPACFPYKRQTDWVVVVSRFARVVRTFLVVGSIAAPGSVWAQADTDAAPVAGAAAMPATIGLRPGDVLRLKIWREPDLSGDFTLDAAGVAVLPKLGPVQVDTFPVDSIRGRLTRAYQAFLNNPSIEVTPLRRIAVLGAVMKPGLYPVDPTMTVADVVALAGGAAQNGRSDRVELRRAGKRVPGDLSPDSDLAGAAMRSGDQLFVPERSWLARNTWVISGILGVATAVAVSTIP